MLVRVEGQPDRGRGFRLSRVSGWSWAAMLCAVAVVATGCGRSAEDHWSRGTHLARMLKFPEAVEELKKAIEIDPNYAEAYYNLGYVYFQRTEYKEAEKYYTKAIELWPYEPRGYHCMGQVYEMQGLYEEALRMYRDALLISPNYAIAYKGLADVYVKQGKPQVAIERYQEAARRFYQDPTPYPDQVRRSRIAEVHRDLGTTYMGLGRTDRAVRELRRALTIDEHCYKAHTPLAQCLLQKQEFAGAEEYLSKAIEYEVPFDGTSREARTLWYLLGKALTGQRKVGQAILAYEKLEELAGKVAEAEVTNADRQLLSEVKTELASLREAKKQVAERLAAAKGAADKADELAELKAATEGDVGSPEVWLRLGDVQFDLSGAEDAGESLSKAVDLVCKATPYQQEFDDALYEALREALVKVGRRLLETKKFEKALAQFEAASKPQLSSYSAGALLALYKAQAYEGKGLFRKAANNYEEYARSLKPESSEEKRYLGLAEQLRQRAEELGPESDSTGPGGPGEPAPEAGRSK